MQKYYGVSEAVNKVPSVAPTTGKFTKTENQKQKRHAQFFSQIGRGDNQAMDDAFLYSTSDMSYNAVTQLETVKNDSTGNKPGGKKKKATVVCDTDLTEE